MLKIYKLIKILIDSSFTMLQSLIYLLIYVENGFENTQIFYAKSDQVAMFDPK